MSARLLGVSVLVVGLAASPAAWGGPPDLEHEPAPTPDPAPELEPPPSAPEPAEPEPPAPSLPSYDSDIPRYADVPELPEVPPEPELPPRRPKEGLGRIAVGSILLGGGVALLGTSTSMLLIGEDPLAWIGGVVVGVGSMAAGLGSVIAGAEFHKHYRAWAEPLGGVKAIPRSGVGLIGSGITCIGAGGFGVTLAAMSLTMLQDQNDPPYGQVMLPLALTSVVIGVGLFSAGVVRRRKFRPWDAQRQLLPVVAPLGGLGRQPTGATFGVAGRF